MMNDNPKLFISYSWSNHDHQQWVIDLSTQLRESGIDVILDKWDLKEGQDALAFMEKIVSDPEIKKVAMICDQVYVEKADGRSGGVGTETQIITPEIYTKQDQTKFVAILSERDINGKPYLPAYYKSRVYIDLSSSDLYANNFDQLLRWIYDKPFYVKPEIGTKPSFLSDDNPISLETTSRFRRALDAIRENKGYADSALQDYLSTFTTNLEKFRIDASSGEFDDKVVDNIERFLPFRNEAIDIFFAIAQYRNSAVVIQRVHRFFENILPYMLNPDNATTDNYKFIVHELFLYAIACFIKHECFDAASYLLRAGYYVEGDSEYGRSVTVPFAAFYGHVSSLTRRNERLKLKRLSLHADLLMKRANTSGISPRQLLQADFVLYIRDCFDALRSQKRQLWWPVTLVYAQRREEPLEIFARSQSKEYFDRSKLLFDVQQKDDYKLLLEAFDDNGLRAPKFDWQVLYPKIFIDFDKLATRP